MPAYAHYRLDAFCRADPPAVLGALTAAYAADAYTTQRTDATTAWNSQTEYLQTAARQLIERFPASADWHLLLEYQIPRRARRIDAVLLAADVVLVLEFKTGESPLTAADRRQVEDYALDLRDFHTASCGRIILPLLVAPQQHFEPTTPESVLGEPVQRVHLLGNSSPADFLLSVYSRHHRETETPIDPGAWNGSEYRPVPTIIEAAQRLYADHRVRDIAHSHAGADNLTRTADAVLRVIDEARRTNTKAVCFITGVPGAGKTLAGLNIVHSAELHQDRDALGVFLSGNGPLVKVLTEALARDRAERKEEPLGEARRQVKTFIQNVHQFLAAHSRPESPLPPDHVVVFDEAQRAWDLEQARRKFKRTESEPTQMLRTLDRLPDWAVLVALVGGGQEIHRGEAGLPEWGRALQTTFGSWKVYVAPTLAEGEEGPGGAVLFPDGSGALAVHRDDALHLSLGRRSYKAEVVANWVDALLTGNAETARNYAPQLSRFPLALTRSLDRARGWLRDQKRGTRRAGLVASSGARRLRPHGLDVTTDLDEPAWFLQPAEDVRSSPFLELAATEFAVQGLELDWAGVCWDADFRRTREAWAFQAFKGTKWQRVKDVTTQRYMLNKYRVLLTRAREGMVIWIPEGSHADETRSPHLYDETAKYLCACGVETIDV